MHTCSRCGKVVSRVGYNSNHDPFCYDCCAVLDSEQMRDSDRITLYLVKNAEGKHEVTNWPGTLRYSVASPVIGKHNIARIRRDVSFKDIHDQWWHGTQYGNDSELCYCKKLKHEPGYIIPPQINKIGSLL